MWCVPPAAGRRGARRERAADRPAPTRAAVPPAAPVFGSAVAPAESVPAPIAREYWSPPGPAVTTKEGRAKPRTLLALVAVASMAFGWVAVGHFLPGDPLPPGTSAFVAGHGVPYSSPDHTFDASFPSTPTVEQRAIPVASWSATLSLGQAQTDDYEVVAASMVLPISIPDGQAEAAVHDIVEFGTAATNSHIASEKPVVEDGVSGVEVRAKVSDGYSARLMVLSSGRRIFLLGVHAKTGTDRLYKALVDSLVLY